MTAPPKPKVIGTKLADGIGWVKGPLANSYVVRDGARTYLIDSGFPDNAGPLRLAFRRAGVPLSSITDILLTHQHMDHIGGAAYLRWVTNAKVACHEMDAPAVEGRGPLLGPFVIRVLFARHPVPVDRVLKEGDQVGPFTVVSSPGHTLGSVSYYLPERKVLFCGDAAVTTPRGVSLASPFSNFDADTAIRSMEKIAGLEVDSLFAGHGRPIVAKAGPMLKAAAKRLTKKTERKWWTLVGPEGNPETHPKPESAAPQ